MAMTATEQKAISTTYVLTSKAERHRDNNRETSYLTRDSCVSGCGMGSLLRLAKDFPLQFNALTLFFLQQNDMRQVQAVQGRLHTSPNPRRRRADDHLLRVHELRQPLEVLLKRQTTSRARKSTLFFHIQPRSSEGGATWLGGYSRHSGAKRVFGSLRSKNCNSSMIGRRGFSCSSFPHHPFASPLACPFKWNGTLGHSKQQSRADQGQVESADTP